MQVIAEGVENFEQVTYLREHGITAAQGYVFAPPLPGSVFLELVKAIDPQPSKIVAGNLGEAPQNVRMAVNHAAYTFEQSYFSRDKLACEKHSQSR
jgi:predicted signal transduction protein with EAL and GGDEF domain